jgi:importin-5
MEAFAAFFRTLGKKAQAKYYNLIPSVLNILVPIKESGDSDDLSKALVALIDLAEVAPKMFKPLFSNLVSFSVSVIQDKELDNVCRQNALELMATFADYAPSMCRKDASYTNDMITQCLSLMTDLGEDDDDAAEWLANDDVSRLPFSLSVRKVVLTRRSSWTKMRATRIMWPESRLWTDLQISLEARPFSPQRLVGCPV